MARDGSHLMERGKSIFANVVASSVEGFKLGLLWDGD